MVEHYQQDRDGPQSFDVGAERAILGCGTGLVRHGIEIVPRRGRRNYRHITTSLLSKDREDPSASSLLRSLRLTRTIRGLRKLTVE